LLTCFQCILYLFPFIGRTTIFCKSPTEQNIYATYIFNNLSLRFLSLWWNALSTRYGLSSSLGTVSDLRNLKCNLPWWLFMVMGPTVGGKRYFLPPSTTNDRYVVHVRGDANFLRRFQWIGKAGERGKCKQEFVTYEWNISCIARNVQ